MEQTSDLVTTEQKIYKEREIIFGAYLGGPLVGGYMLAENFKVLQQRDKVKKTWLFTILITFIMLGIAMILPDSINFPNFLFPLIYTFIGVLVFNSYQKTKVQAHIQANGAVHSWGRTIGVSIIGLAIFVSIVLCIVGLTQLSYLKADTKTYGIVKNEISYDKENITEVEIDKVAEGFKTMGFFDDEIPKYIFVEKEGNSYVISVSCSEIIKTDNDACEYFIELRKEMQNLYPGNKLIFNLFVDDIENVVKRIE